MGPSTIGTGHARLRLAAWALIAVGAAYLTGGGGGGSNGVYFTPYRILGVGWLVGALAGWLVLALSSPEWRPRTALGPGFAASLLALAAATAASAQPRLGFDYLAYAALATGGYLLLVRLFAQPFFGHRLGSLAVLLGFGLSLVYVAVVVARWIELWLQLGHLTIPPLRPGYESLGLGDPSGLATVVILLLLASVAQVGLATNGRRAIVLAIGVLTAAVVLLTGSRSAWVGVAAVAVLGLGFGVARRDLRAAAAVLARSRAVQGGIAIVAVVAVVVGLVLSRSLSGRLGEPALDTRTAFAHASLAMFADHPVTGVGPGMWTVDRIQFTHPPDVDYYIPHAQNLVLQTLAELGLVGAVAGLIVVAVVLRLVRRGLRSDDPLTRRLGWATLFGGTYLLVNQVFSLYANMPAVWFCYALAVARLDARLTDDRPVSRRAFGPVALGLALVFGAAGAWLAHSEQAALANDAAVSAANGDDWPGALAAARTAAELDPAMPPYQFGLGLAEAHAGDRAAAVDHLRASAEIDDYPVAWLDVARLELDLGRPDEARAALGRAMRLGYQQPQVAVGASQLELELGDRSAAVAALADALLVAPSLASDPFWIDPVRGPVLADALTAALATATPETGYRLALEGGRPADAAAFVAAMPPAEQAVPALVVRAWAGDLAAFEELHARAVADPLDVDTVVLCRRLQLAASTAGRPTAPWTCSGAGRPDIALVVRVSPGLPAPLAGLPGPDASVHVIYGYRRLAPYDKLVPGITPLTPRFE